MPSQPPVSRSRARRWIAHLWREWTIESWRPIAPAFVRPQPNEWRNDQLTASWLGHSTVLINFFGINVITDPVLFPRIGIRIPFLFNIGPKRLTKPALKPNELPPIDLILLSHAHFDHIDTRTLHKFLQAYRRHHRSEHARPFALDAVSRSDRTPLGRIS